MVATPVRGEKALRATFGSDAEFERLHPRDRLGRFIETGAEVRIWGGALARVLGNVGGGRLMVLLGTGQRRTIHRNYLTVTQRPDGAQPTRNADTVAAADPVDPTDDTPDITPDNVSQRGTHLKTAFRIADGLEEDGQEDLADDLRDAATAYQTALRKGDADDEADARAEFLSALDLASEVRQFDIDVAPTVAAAEREDTDAQPPVEDPDDLTPEQEAEADREAAATPDPLAGVDTAAEDEWFADAVDAELADREQEREFEEEQERERQAAREADRESMPPEEPAPTFAEGDRVRWNNTDPDSFAPDRVGTFSHILDDGQALIQVPPTKEQNRRARRRSKRDAPPQPLRVPLADLVPAPNGVDFTEAPDGNTTTGDAPDGEDRVNGINVTGLSEADRESIANLSEGMDDDQLAFAQAASERVRAEEQAADAPARDVPAPSNIPGHSVLKYRIDGTSVTARRTDTLNNKKGTGVGAQFVVDRDGTAIGTVTMSRRLKASPWYNYTVDVYGGETFDVEGGAREAVHRLAAAAPEGLAEVQRNAANRRDLFAAADAQAPEAAPEPGGLLGDVARLQAEGVTGREAWDNLAPGTRIRVGFEENAHDGTFLGVTETDDPDRPLVRYRTDNGNETQFGLTSSRGRIEAPRMARTPAPEPEPEAPGAPLATQQVVFESSSTATLDEPEMPDVAWGEPYGDLPAYNAPIGPVWMFRRGQRVRFYSEGGVQVGSEQRNVAPAAAWAQQQGWTAWRTGQTVGADAPTEDLLEGILGQHVDVTFDATDVSAPTIESGRFVDLLPDEAHTTTVIGEIGWQRDGTSAENAYPVELDLIRRIVRTPEPAPENQPSLLSDDGRIRVPRDELEALLDETTDRNQGYSGANDEGEDDGQVRDDGGTPLQDVPADRVRTDQGQGDVLPEGRGRRGGTGGATGDGPGGAGTSGRDDEGQARPVRAGEVAGGAAGDQGDSAARPADEDEPRGAVRGDSGPGFGGLPASGQRVQPAGGGVAGPDDREGVTPDPSPAPSPPLSADRAADRWANTNRAEMSDDDLDARVVDESGALDNAVRSGNREAMHRRRAEMQASVIEQIRRGIVTRAEGEGMLVRRGMERVNLDPADMEGPAVTADDQPRATAAVAIATIPSDGPRFQPTGLDDFAPAGRPAKLAANMQALRVLRELQKDRGRSATPAEQAALARWSGWGALSEVFDESDPRYADEQVELRELLSESEWVEGRTNSLNAHYSDPRAATAIWDAVKALGFGDGAAPDNLRVLEPGSGIGTFIGFKPDNTEMVGVELDSTTATISKYLYPDETIRNSPFEETDLPDDGFDATVGNVPFGKFPVYDPRHNPDGESIHNAFILKALDVTRPGGLVAVLTSHYTLDSAGNRHRQRMLEKADLVGAVRMPTGGHERIAGTDAVEDLLIFRVREGPDFEPQEDTSWADKARKVVVADGSEQSVNDYFIEHPEHVLGTISGGGQFGSLTVKGDRQGWTDQLPTVLADVVAKAKTDDLTMTPRRRELPALADHTGIGNYEGKVLERPDGTFAQYARGALTPFKVPSTQADELRALITIRDTFSALIAAETSTRDTDEAPEVEQLRVELNEAYDAYVNRYGPINRFTLNKAGNRNTPPKGGFRRDPRSAVVRGLEDYDPGTGEARKTAIFSKRALTRREPAGTADTAEDALILSMDTWGEVNLPAIADLLGVDEQEARAKLGTLVYDDLPDPSDDVVDGIREAVLKSEDSGGPLELPPALAEQVTDLVGNTRLVPAPEYVSGDVRRKLLVARAAAITDERFQANIAGLQTRVPRDLGIDEIDGRLGAPWVPSEVVEQFVKELLNDTGYRSKTKVVSSGGSIWTVVGPRTGVLATSQWGTTRKPAPELIHSLLEQRSIKVTDEVDDPPPSRILNPTETFAAQEKAEAIKERFAEWLWEDADRARRLQRTYNEQFNNLALRDYSGARRDFPGMSSEWKTKVHQHVINAVERIVSEPSALLAHVVGAGKTAEMVMGSAELRRLGLARKPAFVVPNHMLEQFGREYLEIYPGARLLAAGSDDLSGDGRREFIARAATGDWDAVIITKDAFKSIPMSPERTSAYIERQLADMRAQLEAQKQSVADREKSSYRDVAESDPAKRTIKKMETQIKNAEKALKKHLGKAKDAKGVSFEETGIDYLFVDEAHEYSNMRITSNTEGGGSAGSGLATDLDMKLDYLRETNVTDRVATFATGTPIRNTVTQAYAMTKFLRPDLLRKAGITNFDQWAATFGDQVEEMELKPEGKGFRQTSRFAKFRNVPELLRMFHTFADVKMAEDLNLPTPDLAGGKVETVTVPRTQQLKEFIDRLGVRAENIRAGGVPPEDDNMLNVSTDGRKAALSMALVGGRHEPGKIEAAADKIGSIYDATKNNRYPADPKNPDAGDDPTPGALQIVFMDLGTPKVGKSSDEAASVDDNDSDFVAYDHLKAELVARGIPAEKIRYIHEAKNDDQKAEMFADARAGRISVLLGSSQKMGVGTNMQARAIALHHLDAPWRPADVEQRDGRIMRQGNLNPEVSIHRYVTEGSFDAYMWQTLERKAKFINQVMRGSLNVREIEDVGDTALSFAEVKALATGNMDLLVKAKIDTVVARLSRLQRAHNRNQTNLRTEQARQTERIERSEENVAAYEAALVKRVSTAGDEFRLRRGDIEYEDREEAGAALKAAVNDVIERDRFAYRENPRVVGEIGGHTVTATVVPIYSYGRALIEVKLQDVPGSIWRSSIDNFTDDDVTPMGLIRRTENRLNGMDDDLAYVREQAEQGREELGRVTAMIGAPFTQERELNAAMAKQVRLGQKIARDAKREEGHTVPFDPRIDTDRHDDPILGDPADLPPPEERDAVFASDRRAIEELEAAEAAEGVSDDPEFASDVVAREAREDAGGRSVAADAVRAAIAGTGNFLADMGEADPVDGLRVFTVILDGGRRLTFNEEGGILARSDDFPLSLVSRIIGAATGAAEKSPRRGAVERKEKANPFGKGGKGGGDKPPAINTGSFVSWSGGRGRVDVVVTNGKVPGMDTDVVGEKGSPAARVTVWEKDGDGYKATSRKHAAKTATLKRIPPLSRRTQRKDAAAELVTLLADHERKVATGVLPRSATVSASAVKEVWARGVQAYPGAEVTTLTPQEWAVGRVNAFLTKAAGQKVKFYRADDDLLPQNRVQIDSRETARFIADLPAAPADTGRVTIDAAEVKAALADLDQ